VHRSLFAVRGGAIIGLAPRLAERMQTAPNPSPGFLLPGCSHSRRIYAVSECAVVTATVFGPICEEHVTERLPVVAATPVPVTADRPLRPGEEAT
jgi:hypothetical protein